MIFRTIRKIFDPKYTDMKVEAIKDQNRKVFEDTDRVAKRHVNLLKKDGIMMRIYIASGGDHRGH